MLFALRGSGRRTTVKVVYVTLAILMGGGLVLFGIGGSVSGGLIDAITRPAGAPPHRRAGQPPDRQRRVPVARHVGPAQGRGEPEERGAVGRRRPGPLPARPH